MTTVHRVYNFSSGPAVLPVSVLEEIQRDLLALPGVGMSVLEISHRSKAFESILADAEADIRAIGVRSGELQSVVPAGWRQPAVLHGPHEPARRRADGRLHRLWLVGGEGRKEAKKVATVNIAASTKAERYSRIPAQSELKLTPRAAYVHMTVEQHHRGHAVSRRCPTWARRRWSATRRRTCSAGRSTSNVTR